MLMPMIYRRYYARYDYAALLLYCHGRFRHTPAAFATLMISIQNSAIFMIAGTGTKNKHAAIRDLLPPAMPPA